MLWGLLGAKDDSWRWRLHDGSQALTRETNTNRILPSPQSLSISLYEAPLLPPRAVTEPEKHQSKREKERERQTDRQTERQIVRQTERQRDRNTERERERERETSQLSIFYSFYSSSSSFSPLSYFLFVSLSPHWVVCHEVYLLCLHTSSNRDYIDTKE